MRQLCNLAARAIATHEPVSDYIELPEECWTISTEVVDAPVSREVGFVTKAGTMGRAQVFTGATRDGLIYVIFRDVTVEARLHAKYRVQLEANEQLKLDYQRTSLSSSVLRKIILGIPAHADRTAALASIGSRLKSELGFSEVYFVQELADGAFEPIGFEKRLEPRVQQLLARMASDIEGLKAGDLARSLAYEGEGVTWAVAFRPRLEKPAIMLAYGNRPSEHFELRGFFEMLAHLGALHIDNTNFYFGAVIDPISGVYNRRFFDARFAIEGRRASDRRGALSLLVIEIDGLGAISERYGGGAGEALLQSVAQVVKRRLRGSDCVARTGIHQLAVILPETLAGDAAKVADSIRTQVETVELRFDSTVVLKPTISCGVAGFNWTEDRIEDVMQAAQVALEKAKDQGGQRIQIHMRAAG